MINLRDDVTSKIRISETAVEVTDLFKKVIGLSTSFDLRIEVR